jgi:hypothetical protein
MSSLIDDNTKSEYAAIMSGLHDTFKRSIYYYLENNTLSLSSNGSYNAAYGKQQPTVNVTTQMSSGVLNARIHYIDPLDRRTQKEFQDANIPFNTALQLARIKIDATDYNIFKSAKTVIIDGTVFEMISSAIPIAPFAVNYRTILLAEKK